MFSEAKHHFPAATAFNLLSVLLAPCHCAFAFLSMSSAAVKQAYKELKAYVCDRPHMTSVELCRNARKEMKAQWRILLEFEKARMGAAFQPTHWKRRLIVDLAPPERFPRGGDRVSQHWRSNHAAALVEFGEKRILSNGSDEATTEHVINNVEEPFQEDIAEVVNLDSSSASNVVPHHEVQPNNEQQCIIKALNMEFRGINQIDSKVLQRFFQLMSQDLNTRKYEAEAAHEKAKEERQTAEAGIRKAQEEQKVVEAGIQKAVEERMAAQARCEAIIRKAEAVKAVKALGKKRRREEMAESSITRANMERPLLGPDCFLSGGCPQMIKFNKTANLTVQCCEVSNPQTLLKTQSGWSAWWNTHQLTKVRCHSATLCTRVAIRGTGEIDMELFGCGSSLMTYCSWFVNL